MEYYMTISNNWRSYLLNTILAAAAIFIIFQMKLWLGNSFEVSLRPLILGLIATVAAGSVMHKFKRLFFIVMAVIGIGGWYIVPSMQDSLVSSFLGGVGIASVLISSYLLVHDRLN